MKTTAANQKFYLGEFEEIVLLAIVWLKGEAYGVKIRQLIERETGRSVSIGGVYTTLERLEKKGYVSSRQGESTPTRGGKAKRYFRIEGAGAEALNQVVTARKRMMAGLQGDWQPVTT